MLRALTTFHANGRTVPANAIVDPKDPIVKGREALFAPVAPTVGGVEQATAEPGEKRTVSRRKV